MKTSHEAKKIGYILNNKCTKYTEFNPRIFYFDQGF